MANKDLSYYMSLPYTIQIRPIKDESGEYYYASVAELDGCQSTGETFVEAFESVREAMEGYLQVKIDHDDFIPKPAGEDEYSGKFNLRVPKSLHRQLAERAAAENVSLNQYCLYKLSR
ncbi:toxin-antitoxin system HicB family antitoxin [Paenibacillus macerans]|uniref:Toxin-antitoxin system HicB family antitoxin n=2 Tax=Paenibacillus TaxID=44249 RepID=A0A6N8F5X2_PAEMA|nr:toxin-antitoxin system HicB family antitoxin [Paenibacillus macerans]OMG47256.1 pilus assembly protein HicB [Paenibacillus macerans]